MSNKADTMRAAEPPDDRPDPDAAIHAARTTPRGMAVDLRPTLQASHATQAELVRQAVQVQAATKAIGLAKAALYSAGFGPHLAAAERQGLRYQAAAPGVGTAYQSGGEPELYATDEPALVQWLDDHHDGAYVVRTAVVHVHQSADLVQALDDIDEADKWTDLADDMKHLLQVLYDHLRVQRDATVDLPALAAEWQQRTDPDTTTPYERQPDAEPVPQLGLPVDPDGAPVPHVAWRYTPRGHLTVRGNKAHMDALVRRYAEQLGVPRALLP